MGSSSMVTCSHELCNWLRLALVLNVNWFAWDEEQVPGQARRQGVIIINASFRSMGNCFRIIAAILLKSVKFVCN